MNRPIPAALPKVCILVLALIHVSLPVTYSNEPLRLSLQDALNHAVRENAEVRTARVELDIAEKLIWETTAAGLPQLNASIGYNYFIDIPTSLVPAEFFGGQPGEFEQIQFGTPHSVTATASVEQLIFDGQYIVGLRAARIYREIAGRNVQRSEFEVANTVRETYYLALLASENLRILKQNHENIERLLAEYKALLKEGFTDPINVDQLRLMESNIKQLVSAMERQEQITLSLLKFQTGIDRQAGIELTDSLDDLFQKTLPEALGAASPNKEQHIDYLIAGSREAMSQMVLRREQSAYLPSISASFVRQEMAMRDGFNFFDGAEPWFPATYLALNLNIPIFSSGMRRSRVQQAQLELEKSKIAREQVGRAILLQVEEAITSLHTAYEQFLNEESSLETAGRIFERTSIMFREGMASSMELNQANEQLLSTQSGYLRAKFDVLSAHNQLEKALGK